MYLSCHFTKTIKIVCFEGEKLNHDHGCICNTVHNTVFTK